MIDVTTRGHHVPDPEWSHFDSNGHEHRFEASGDLPTLEWVVTYTYWCEMCRDEHEEGEWRCRLCGDTVEPRYGFTGPQTHMVPGLAEAILTVNGREYQLSPEVQQFNGLSAEALRERALALAHERERGGTPS